MHRSLSRSAFARFGRETLIANAFFFCVLLCASFASATHADAQQSARRLLPPLELRADVIDPRSTQSGTVHAGIGTKFRLAPTCDWSSTARAA